MMRIALAMVVFALFVATVSTADDGRPRVAASEAQMLEGLWRGTWGGGQRDGIVFQPVIGELLIKGDHIEWIGFPVESPVTGSVRFDTKVKRLQITRTDAPTDQKPKPIELAYEIKGDTLTLSDGGKLQITLQRKDAVEKPLADVQIDLVTAVGINKEGELLVNEYTELRAGRAGATYFQPHRRLLKTKQATVLLVQETGCKKINIDEARRLIHESRPVAVTYRHDDRPPPEQYYVLVKDMGSPAPDSDAVLQTVSKTLRPGTLVFVLSAKENVPVP